MLDERVVVITGAGRGIGRAHALAMAAAGAQVVVNDLGVTADGSAPSSTPADDVVEEIRQAGGQAVASHHDVAGDGGADGVVSTALDAFGRLDAVVNNAGILRSGLLLRTEPAEWRAVFEVHLVGTLAMTKAAGLHWRAESKAGREVDARIVNTSSSAGLYGFVGEPAYSAAKAGIIGFTLTAAAELGRYGVLVNAVAPAASTRLTAWAGDDPAMAPELVSPLVVWLVSSASAGITARVFEVGGGTVHLIAGPQRAAAVEHDLSTSPADLGARIRDALAGVPESIAPTVPTTSGES